MSIFSGAWQRYDDRNRRYMLMKYEKTSVRQILFAKVGYILISVLFSTAGIFMILKPEISTEIICVAAGILLIIFGIIKIIGYFSKDLYRLAFQYDLAFGILRIILGIIFCTHTAGVVNLFFTAMGILVLADGLFRIQLAVDARAFGIRQWWLILLIAVVTGLFGMLLLLRPVEGMQAVMILLGCSMLSEGILNLCVAVCTTRVAAGWRER